MIFKKNETVFTFPYIDYEKIKHIPHIFSSNFCVYFSTMAERKAVIKNADMSEDMQQDAVDCASQALEKYNIEKVNDFHFAFFCISILPHPFSSSGYCCIH